MTELDMDEFVKALNSAFRDDPSAIFTLTQTLRIPCNHKLAHHPFVIVDSMRAINDDGFPEHPSVGFLGLLNGLLHSAGYDKSIASKWTTDDVPRLLGYCIVDKPIGG